MSYNVSQTVIVVVRMWCTSTWARSRFQVLNIVRVVGIEFWSPKLNLFQDLKYQKRKIIRIMIEIIFNLGSKWRSSLRLRSEPRKEQSESVCLQVKKKQKWSESGMYDEPWIDGESCRSDGRDVNNLKRKKKKKRLTCLTLPFGSDSEFRLLTQNDALFRA